MAQDGPAPTGARLDWDDLRFALAVADAGGRVVFTTDAALKPGRDRTRAEANLACIV